MSEPLADRAGPYHPDPAHLFMQLYDELPGDLFRGTEPGQWRDAAETRRRVERVEQVIRRDGMARYDRLAHIVAWPGIRGLFTMLLGIDRALWYANPFSACIDTGGLTRVAARYARTGLFNDPAVVPGALLPRCTMPGRPLGGDRQEDFFSVHRVQPGDWEGVIDYGIVAPHQQPGFGREERLKVACLPFLETYEEMGLHLDLDHGSPTYRVGPASSPDLLARITTLVEKMDATGARIGVVPEGCLSDTLLDEWTKIAFDTYSPGKPLRWLLLGSGPLGGFDPPVNRTVLLDRVSGEKIFEYDKRRRFTIDREQIQQWGLPWPSSLNEVREDIQVGEQIAVRDSSLGRVAALICEDLAQSIDWEREFAAYGVSHLLVPVLSKPIIKERWEQRAADRAAQQLGIWVVVSNSLAAARASHDRAGESDGGDPARASAEEPVNHSDHSSDGLYTCVVCGPGDHDRRSWTIVRQFGRASTGDDLGWIRDDDGREGLPIVLAGGINPSWFGGEPRA